MLWVLIRSAFEALLMSTHNMSSLRNKKIIMWIPPIICSYAFWRYTARQVGQVGPVSHLSTKKHLPMFRLSFKDFFLILALAAISFIGVETF